MMILAERHFKIHETLKSWWVARVGMRLFASFLHIV